MNSKNKPEKIGILDLLLVFFPSYFVFLLTIYPTVGTEDSGELIVSAATLDIAHPPGYPLHTLLGKLFTILIPFGNMGWRVNLLSAFFGAATVTLIYLILRRLSVNDLLALAVSLFVAFSDIFWAQSIRTEVYTLNSFFLLLVTYLLVRWHRTENDKYLYGMAFAYGLSLTNHHLMFLAAPPIALYVLVRKWKIITKPLKIGGMLLLFILGLTVYLYLPIRSLAGPYDNPAYIEHVTLNTSQSFLNFVNRKIYGGTIHKSQEDAEEETRGMAPSWLTEFTDSLSGYFKSLADNNISGLIPMLFYLCEQLFWLPLLLFIPGIYLLFKKFDKLGILIVGIFVFYTVGQLTFIGVSFNMIPFSAFSVRPFFISGIIILALISGLGLQTLLEWIPVKAYKQAFVYILFFLPFLPLTFNFSANNESGNYLAYDFNRNLLESVPPGGYLLSTGRDNLTFPLYYLRKIDHIRPDVDLEIYYGKSAVDKSYLEGKMKEKNRDAMFIDLLPNNYLDLNLVPYNFIYAYGQTDKLPPQTGNLFSIRGIRKTMDYPNSKLKGLYLLKMATHYNTDFQKVEQYFNRVLDEIPYNEQFKNFISDYRSGQDDTGMF